MAKEKIPFSDFLKLAGPEHEEFINSLHEYVTEKNAVCNIKESKSGYVVSYVDSSKATVANYVFRKKGPMLRIYADNVGLYMDFLDTMPVSMKETIENSGPCKRMIDPDACNPRCKLGFDFFMDNKHHQKCRNGGFMFFLNDETKPYLRTIMEKEMELRK